ncbi:hypothetical protein [Peribacillus sp. ACCC06369]|uniref:hypothetical protein n=1 Tax=Peribacillus sp. ACCC06369 TaxID=3055860 RepID=UPI0025A0755F|nr:hypothetical protein [Peribacillus sp. ACCC06369]MDM5358803.1 hypothetical protein [Peribacillus sp. ACCC06369]
MLNFLFWNLRKKNLHSPLAHLCRETEANIIIVNEFENLDISALLHQLGETYSEVVTEHSRIKIFHNLGNDVSRISGNTYYTAVRIKRENLNLNVAGVHLQGQSYTNEKGRLALATRLRTAIADFESSEGHNNTVILGDFNMNPFESGMISAEGFHAIMCPITAVNNVVRQVYEEDRMFFYNPMWHVYGNITYDTLGTYYYNSGIENYLWHCFDQVILRPNLVGKFNIDSLKILTKFNEEEDLLFNGVPNKNVFSDHLPISFTLNV